MKKVLTVVLAIGFLFVCAATAWAAPPAAVVFVDGEELVSDTPAVIIEGRTLLPMRAVFEALDQEVDWDNDTKTVTSGDIVLKIDDAEAIVAGEAYELDVPATLIDNRTYVPLRFVAETLGKTVDWDNDAKRVDILTEDEAVVDEEAAEDEAADEEAVEDEAVVDEEVVEDDAVADEDADADADADAGEADENGENNDEGDGAGEAE